MTLSAIKEILQELPEEELTALAAWLNERDKKSWDLQIDKDFSPGGAGMALLEEVDKMIEHGDIGAFKVTRVRERT